ncbi:FAD binding domain-containing protein [Chloroflexota bacterium]
MNYALIDTREIEEALAWLNDYWHRPTHPEYYDARTMDEAVSLLDKYGEEAKIIAGGIDVVGLMKTRQLFPGVLINIKSIANMANIAENDGGIAIGALSLINDIERSSLIRSKYHVLFEAARSIASPQLRNMATVGGNLCQDVRCLYYRMSPVTGVSYNCRRKKEDSICYAINGENQHHAIMSGNKCFAVCPSDMATVLLALGAELHTVSTSGGRVIPVSEFYVDFGNVLKPEEIVKTIQVPDIEPGVKQRFLKFRLRKTIDFAIVSVAAVISFNDNIVSNARIVLGGVSSAPYRAVEAEKILVGEPLTKNVVEEAARAAVIKAMPLSKNGYKVPIGKALVKRALLK